jgi:hypothetical protein
MQLNFKAFAFILLFLIPIENIFSQEDYIATKFSQDGSLFKNFDDDSKLLTEFKENDKCLVISFLGKYTYKIKYKGWEGYVTDEFLFVNEDMMDLYFDHEEKQRIKAIQEKEERQNKILEITNAAKNEKNELRRQDSIAKAKVETKRLELVEIARKKQEKIYEQKRLDALAKAKTEEQKRLQELEVERIRTEQLNAQRKQDSIAKVKVEEKRLELLEIERKKQEEIAEQKRLNALAKAKTEEQKRLQELEVERIRTEQLNAQRKQDSIAKVKVEEKRLKLLEIESNKQEQIAEQKKIDAIEKAKADEQNRLQALEVERISEQKKLEAIKKAIQEEQTRLNTLAKERGKLEQIYELRRQDSNAIINDKKQEELMMLNRQDSIAKINEVLKENVILERMKFRNTCHYFINEFDKYYNEKTIRTEPYKVGENLTIELYRQGRSVNVFFNLSKDLGCASYLSNNRSSIRVELENNQEITFYHTWNIECGEFNFKGKISSSQMQKLKESPIKSIRFRGTQNSYNTSSIEYKEFFIDKLKCLE